MKLVIENDLKEALKPELSRLNMSLEKFAGGSDGFLGELLSYVLIGSGKRVRPALVFLTSRLGDAPIESVREVAEAVELVHIATLIHDDVIDKSALRRGRKTVYSEYGVDTAVLLGDHVYTRAFEKVAELDNPLILKLLARSTAVMCAGEIEQLRRRYQYDLTEEEYFSFIDKKTAALFGVSAQAGAILAGQNEQVQQGLVSYGVHLGKAFQITDDVLDLTGAEVVVGKTLRTDLLNGKMTLPLLHFRDHAPSAFDVKRFLDMVDLQNGSIDTLIEQMTEAGSLHYAEMIAKSHVQAALRSLDSVPTSDSKNLLISLAELLLKETRNLPLPSDDPQPLTLHLDELRSRLIQVFVCWLITSAFSYHYVDPILTWLAKPVGQFIFTDPTEALFVRFKLAFGLGAVVAFPFFLFHLYRFIGVALKGREKSFIFIAIPIAIGLFLAGACLCIFVVAPIASKVLLNFGTPTLIPMISVESYLSFLFWMVMGFGILFQLPLVVMALCRAGVIDPATLSQYRKHVFVVLLVVAAFLTPGPDVFSQVVLTLPAYILFEISLLLVRYWK